MSSQMRGLGPKDLKKKSYFLILFVMAFQKNISF